MNEDHSTEGKPQQKLWTRDFTIITLGSVVSMVGGTMTGFAISIMVLDYTGSTFLYALFNICFQIPMLVCPLLAGPVLDRMSRKKVIYSLDFLSSFVFLVFYLVMRSGWFSYPFLLAGTLLIGEQMQTEDGDQAMVDYLSEVLSQIEDRGLTSGVSLVDFSDPSDVQFMYAGRLTVQLGADSNTEYKFGMFVSVLDKLSSEDVGLLNLSDGVSAHFMPE